MQCMNGTCDETRLGHERGAVCTAEAGSRIRMHPSRPMVLLTRIVGCTNGVLGEECSASGNSRVHEAA